MSWVLHIDSAVKKYLKKVPKQDARRIFDVIEQLTSNPYEGDIEKMGGEEDAWRRRIGSYRLLYEILVAKKIIHVTDVKRRTSHTY